MSQPYSIQSTINYIKNELNPIYSSREGESISYLLLEHVLDCSRMHLQLNKSDVVEDDTFELIAQFVEELKTKKPLQYILGEADFYDLKFKVNEHTLIPRPETEELVHAIINENKTTKLNILDIGTGSGCIPICLAKNLKQAKLSTADISAKAIETAKENARLNNVEISFYNRDILKWKDFNWEKYDIIVSNPPYVTEAEKEKMEDNVLKYEPHTALFVSNHDPLIFYRTISELAISHLKKGGKLYFEINESLGDEMKELLEEKGFTNILLHKDINGKNRMMSAIKTA